MFYLTTHSTHFYLRLYGVRHMVKDHSDSERGNLLPLHRLLVPISNRQDSTYHVLCYTSCLITSKSEVFFIIVKVVLGQNRNIQFSSTWL